MGLQIQSSEEVCLKPFLLEPPSRQHGDEQLAPGDFLRAGAVAVDASSRERFNGEAFSADAVGRPHEAAKEKTPSMRKLDAAEQEKPLDRVRCVSCARRPLWKSAKERRRGKRSRADAPARHATPREHAVLLFLPFLGMLLNALNHGRRCAVHSTFANRKAFRPNIGRWDVSATHPFVATQSCRASSL
jgi:hypothetical protein